MSGLDFSEMRADKRIGMRKLLDAIVTYFRQHRNIPSEQDLARLSGIELRTIKAYLRDLSEKLGLLKEPGVPPRYAASIFVYLLQHGEIQIPDDAIPQLPITPELRTGLEAVPFLQQLTALLKSSLPASAERETDDRYRQADLLFNELKQVEPFSGPQFRRAQEVLGLSLPNTFFRAGGEHAFWQRRIGAHGESGQFSPHPDNRAGLQGILGKEFLRRAMTVRPEELPTRLGANLVLVGGAVSEMLSRIHLGYYGGTDDRLSRRQDLLALPYWIVYDDNEARHEGGSVTRQMLDYTTGELIMSTRPNWWIRTSNSPERFVPRATGGLIETDYLLITRLRNCFKKRSNTYFLSIAGPHGTGTKSIRLLMGNAISSKYRQILHDVDNELQGADEFQILLEVTEIERALTGSEPRTLRLLDAVRLHIREEQHEKLYQWIQGQLGRAVVQGLDLETRER